MGKKDSQRVGLLENLLWSKTAFNLINKKTVPHQSTRGYSSTYKENPVATVILKLSSI